MYRWAQTDSPYNTRMIDLRQDGDALLLPVKVVPGASASRISGEYGGRLKVAVSAPPEKGKANGALLALLAKQLGLRRSDLAITAGLTSPDKTVRVPAASAHALRALLTRAQKKGGLG